MVEAKIGLEVHCQLNTKSKLFCSCPNEVSNNPNTLTCEICLGHPGAKPVLNKEVLKKALTAALALNCRINEKMIFSRKTYFYPDLPNNFQITQYEMPLAVDGKLGSIRIKRLHIEEDPGRLVRKEGFVLIDYNRSGTPLIETVTEPDFKSSDEAKEFLQKFVNILEYLNIYYQSSEATLRCDVNVSINNGTRVEVKNVYGIHEVKKVIDYEIQRQQNEKAVQETRGWDEESKTTYSMRLKESEEDYGYITEPNLPAFEITKDMIKGIKLPELGHDKASRYVKEFKLNKEDAEVIASYSKLAEIFEAAAKKVNPGFAAKWLRRELLKSINESNKDILKINVDNRQVIALLELFEKKKITDKIAKQLMERLLKENFDIKEYVKEQDLGAVSEESELLKLCGEVIAENPKVVNDYKSGKLEAINFLVGQVMRKSKGKASPDICKKLLNGMI